MANDKSIAQTGRGGAAERSEEIKHQNTIRQIRKQIAAEEKALAYEIEHHNQLKLQQEKLDETRYLAEIQRQYLAANMDFDNAAKEKALKQFSQLQLAEQIKNTTRVQQQEKKAKEELLKAESEARKAILNDPNASKEEKKEARRAEREATKEARAEEAREKNNKQLEASINKFVNGLEAFNSTINKYAGIEAVVNTRIQGSDLEFSDIEKKLTKAVGVNPYIKTEKLLDSIVKVSDAGILFNLEQRAFLESVSDKIAATFDVTNGTILRLVRLQQADSTAARLGMEASMTRFLNSMYENTEYLISSFDKVTDNLSEAISQMTVDQSIQFEYMVQKWLGSLESVGMDSSTITNIAAAIGYLGSGDINNLSSNSQMQNLIVMAATQAGLSYSDMLVNGLDSASTNKLLQSIIEYLQKISDTDNKVVKSQYAQIFGVKLSDLTAVNNLRVEDLRTVSNNALDYAASINELSYQMGQIGKRMNSAELIQNVIANAKFGLATGIADDPVSSALWEVTGLIQNFTGGINIPAISVMGSGVDLNTTVENLMRLGLVGINSLGMIGDIVSGIGNTFNPAGMLGKVGITNNNIAVTSRGSGILAQTSGVTEASYQTVGNSSGSDMYESSVNEASKDSTKTMEEKKKEDQDKMSKTSSIIIGFESEGNFSRLNSESVKTIENDVRRIYDLLKELVSGAEQLTVKVTEMPANYGASTPAWPPLP